MPENEYLAVPIEWKAAGGSDGVMEGYASTFGNVDLGGDIVVKGAFKKTIASIKANGIPLLADHVASSASVIGTIFDAAEDDKGLKIKARFSSAPSAQDVRTKMSEGHLNKLSIGYQAVDYSYAEMDDGRRVRKLLDVKLFETSVVVLPMNTEAAVTRVKSMLGTMGERMRAAVIDALATKDDEKLPADEAGSPGDEPGAKSGDEPGTDNTAPGDEPGGAPDEGAAGWDRWKSAAVLAGRDPEETASLADVAGARTQLELLEADIAAQLKTRKD